MSVPTGSIVIYGRRNFTVPNGVKIIQVSYDVGGIIGYVGVTSGSQHTLESFTGGDAQPTTPHGVVCITHESSENNYIEWVCIPLPHEADPEYRLSWSPEINTHTPNITDY